MPSNKEFAKTNTQFIEACREAGIKPTPRQASKYLNKHGKAYYESQSRLGKRQDS